MRWMCTSFPPARKGPKSVLESMACGIPLVTTRVGQAQDIVRHGENAWMVDVEDAEGLAHWAAYAFRNRVGVARVVREGRLTAESLSYERLTPAWREFMKGFVGDANG